MFTVDRVSISLLFEENAIMQGLGNLLRKTFISGGCSRDICLLLLYSDLCQVRLTFMVLSTGLLTGFRKWEKRPDIGDWEDNEFEIFILLASFLLVDCTYFSLKDTTPDLSFPYRYMFTWVLVNIPSHYSGLGLLSMIMNHIILNCFL